MKIKVWGARGSIPAPGPETMRYGGNTSCVELTLSDGSTLILDAGTGIRSLGTRARPGAAADPHHAYASPSRSHPGPDVLRPGVSPGVGDHDLGSRLRGSLAVRQARAVYLRAARAGRDPSAPLSPLLPRRRAGRVGGRPGPRDRRARQPSRSDTRLPDRGRRHVGLLHPGPRARPRRPAVRTRRRLAVRVRARPAERRC